METATLIARIRSDYRAARKERDPERSQTLLSLVSAIDNASAVDVSTYNNATEVARRVLSVDDVKEIIRNEISEMQEASVVYKDIDTKRTEEFEIKISILKEYIGTV